jgi:hypothetical protein
MIRIALISLSTLLLGACAETSQSQADARKVSDTSPWQGANNSYVAKGWSPGDKVSWDAQLRTRTQHQNEYLKVN